MHQEMKSTKKKKKTCALKVNKYSERNNEFVRLLTKKWTISNVYGSFILMERNTIWTENLENQIT